VGKGKAATGKSRIGALLATSYFTTSYKKRQPLRIRAASHMRKLCSNRGCSRVITAAIFYPEKMYDKLNYRFTNSLG
jgi:hypothetical protein